MHTFLKILLDPHGIAWTILGDVVILSTVIVGIWKISKHMRRFSLFLRYEAPIKYQKVKFSTFAFRLSRLETFHSDVTKLISVIAMQAILLMLLFTGALGMLLQIILFHPLDHSKSQLIQLLLLKANFFMVCVLIAMTLYLCLPMLADVLRYESRRPMIIAKMSSILERNKFDRDEVKQMIDKAIESCKGSFN